MFALVESAGRCVGNRGCRKATLQGDVSGFFFTDSIDSAQVEECSCGAGCSWCNVEKVDVQGQGILAVVAPPEGTTCLRCDKPKFLTVATSAGARETCVEELTAKSMAQASGLVLYDADA